MSMKWARKNRYFNVAFTIVELMIVVAVVAILAGITVVGYGSWQTRLAQGSVQADLKSAAAALEQAKNFGSGYPGSIPSTFKGSSNVTVTYFSGNNGSFCIDGASNTQTSVKYFIDSTRGTKPIAGTCAGGEEIPGLGETWVARTAAEANSWYSVAFGGDLFVAISVDGINRVMTSPDGITWTARTAAEANEWYSVAYGNGKFVAVSRSGTNRVMTSP